LGQRSAVQESGEPATATGKVIRLGNRVA
jgi:hypothetical protein